MNMKRPFFQISSFGIQLNVTYTINCPFCHGNDSDEKLVQTSGWEYGSSARRTPRTLWSHGWQTLLVGRIYKCKNNHHVNSYHPGVLEHIDVVYIGSDMNFLSIEKILRTSFMPEMIKDGRLGLTSVQKINNQTIYSLLSG